MNTPALIAVAVTTLIVAGGIAVYLRWDAYVGGFGRLRLLPENWRRRLFGELRRSSKS